MIELPRRSFLVALGFVAAAPAIVRAASLMPVRSIGRGAAYIVFENVDLAKYDNRLPDFNFTIESSRDLRRWTPIPAYKTRERVLVREWR